MKKYILLLAAFFTISFAQAQSLRLGLKAGAGLASVRDNALSEEFTYKLKLHGGLMLNLPFSELLHLQPEVLYSQKGFEYKTGSTTAVFKSSYIDVPVLLRVNIEGVFLQAGPQVSFLLASQQNEAEFKSATKSTVFGYTAGLGYRANHFQYGLHYTTDISDSYTGLPGGKAGKNVIYQLSIGYQVNH